MLARTYQRTLKLWTHTHMPSELETTGHYGRKTLRTLQVRKECTSMEIIYHEINSVITITSPVCHTTFTNAPATKTDIICLGRGPNMGQQALEPQVRTTKTRRSSKTTVYFYYSGNRALYIKV